MGGSAMSVQRFSMEAPTGVIAVMAPYKYGNYVRYADHVHIVAEAVAEVTDALIASKRGALAEMEQAHAAALAAVERLPGHTAHAYIETSDWSGGQSAQVRFQQSEQGRWVDKGDVLTLLGNAAAAPRILTRDGWWPFGSFVDYDFPLEFDGEGEDGLPIWERPDKSRMQPRTLTADDPGYHSQRCLHCDHIRATHTLTAHGCIGHALPGRPGVDCPCAEFIHDGEATPEVKPCSTCGEPVAYLTARPGWAGGWLHHPARPLDGHPAAIDGEATT